MMLRTLRPLLCLTLLVVPALGLAGCGEDEPVLVGVVLPLSGEFALYGEPIRKGIELAFEEMQAAGELPYEMTLAVEDSQGDPERAARLLADFYDQGSPAVIGGATTDEALEMVKVAEEEDRVLLSPSASSPLLTGTSTNFFRVFPSDFLEGTKMGNFVTQTADLDRLVIVAAESPYARGIQEIFASEVERNGGEVAEVIEYPQGTSELDGVIERVMTLSPEAVYLADYADGLVRLIQGLEQRGFRGMILTTSSFSSPEAIERAGAAAEGVVLTQSVFDLSSEDPQVQEFITDYQQMYGAVPDLYAAHGYDAMRVYVEALREGRQAREMWQGMRGISGFDGVTGTVQFDEKGDVQKFPRVYVIASGELLDYDQVLEGRRQELENRRRQLQERMQNLERRQRALRGDG